MAESVGPFSKGRLEAFSDGVIAVIITIMVLVLKAPEGAEPEALLKLWPAFAIYVVSFVFVAIYWINHHSVLATAKTVDPALIWANSMLLLFLSLIPFATAYVAETHAAPLPTFVYGIVQFFCALSYWAISAVILGLRRDEPAFVAAAKARRLKDTISLAVYVAATLLALWAPLAAMAIFVGVAAAYVLPTLFSGSFEG